MNLIHVLLLKQLNVFRNILDNGLLVCKIRCIVQNVIIKITLRRKEPTVTAKKLYLIAIGKEENYKHQQSCDPQIA